LHNSGVIAQPKLAACSHSAKPGGMVDNKAGDSPTFAEALVLQVGTLAHHCDLLLEAAPIQACREERLRRSLRHCTSCVG
jgi:hypothetical protein